MFKELFEFSKKELSGILVLSVILFILLLFNFAIDYFPGENKKYDFKSFEAAIDSLDKFNVNTENIAVEHKINTSSKQKKAIVKKLLINLNKADTTELRKLRGIGRVYSNRIIKYRNLLGGFTNTNQLLEVYGIKQELYSTIQNQVFIDSNYIIKINLNDADYRTLIRHPYIDKSLTKKILNKQPNNSIFDLENDSIIDVVLLNKLKPYITE